MVGLLIVTLGNARGKSPLFPVHIHSNSENYLIGTAYGTVSATECQPW